MPGLLLLGAGASYGSEPDKALVPPLASQLFDALLKFEPNLWNQVPEDIASLYRADFEQGVLELSKKVRGALGPTQRSMAAFFYRYGPTKDSLYCKLAKRIQSRKWDGAIATLNYERMLPLALHRHGMSTVLGSQESGKTELCFPHGCCHFFCDSVQGASGGVAFDGMAVSTNGPLSIIEEPRAFWHRLRMDAFPPVMSYFEPSKVTTSGANIIEQQRARLDELIAAADSIGIVGIALREQDTHIWDSLAKAKAPIYYCSGKSAKAAFQDWQARKRPIGAGDVSSEKYWLGDFEAIATHVRLGT
jgi:hypothetical protein